MEVVYAEDIGQPLLLPGLSIPDTATVVELPVVPDGTGGRLERRNRITLHVGAMDEPAQRAAQDEHEDHNRAHAYTKPASPEFRRGYFQHLTTARGKSEL